MENKKLIHSYLSLGTYNQFVLTLLSQAEKTASSYTCVANVHMLIEAYKDPCFADIVNNADIVTPDGMPLVFGLKLLYGIRQDRVAGMDLMPDLLKVAEQKSIPVYFYGGTEIMLEKTSEYLHQNYPTLLIGGMYSPPFRPLTVNEEQEVIDKINDSGAKFVFVALGCPKQEKWMASMKGRINACMIGIGGALPVMVGMQKRAPLWMQKVSLEWFYRFCQEPGRLWKRYLVTNSLFIYLILVSYFKRGK